MKLSRFMISCAAVFLNACSGPPEPTADEMKTAVKYMIARINVSQGSIVPEDVLDGLEFQKMNCQSDGAKYSCKFAIRWSTLGDQWFREYVGVFSGDGKSSHGWDADSQFDTTIFKHIRDLLRSGPVSNANTPPPAPMPNGWKGKWQGGGKVDDFGMYADVSLAISNHGALFKLGSCRGGTDMGMRSEGDAFEVVSDNCDPGSIKIRSVSGDKMRIDIERKGSSFSLDLVRTLDFSQHSSTLPDKPIDIIDLPISGPNSVRKKLQDLRVGFPEGSKNAIFVDQSERNKDMIGYHGEVVAVYFSKNTSLDASDANKAVAFGRIVKPSGDLAPKFDETVDGIIKKYGTPSIQEGERFEWYYDVDGKKLLGASAIACSSGASPGVNPVPIFDFRFMRSSYPYNPFSSLLGIKSIKGCGWTILASLSRSGTGTLSSLRIVSYDQYAVLGVLGFQDMDDIDYILEIVKKKRAKQQKVRL